MFGLDNKDDDKQDEAPAVQPAPAQPANNDLLGIDDDTPAATPVDPTAGAPAIPAPDPTPSNDPLGAPTLPSVNNQIDDQSGDEQPASPTNDTPPTTPAPSSSTDDELLDIKREALQELSPLIDHLDQSAEEKFRTTMMMIQASDNQALIPQAFSTAKQISDDKKRAQALLDVVNEINYFTQKETS